MTRGVSELVKFIDSGSCYPTSLSGIPAKKNDEIAVVMTFGDRRIVVDGKITPYGDFVKNAPKRMRELGSPYTIVLFENSGVDGEFISRFVTNVIGTI